MKLVAWALSDTGQSRQKNEDSYLVADRLGLYAVADGMGGHQGGARASSLALEVLEASVAELATADMEEESVQLAPPILPATALMRLATRKASAAVYREALAEPRLEGMGTTVTAMLCEKGRMHLAHVGDSRAYLFRDERLKQLTEDHSWTAEQVRIGAMTEIEAEHSQFRHVITRSVGYESDVNVDCQGVVIQSGDCFLLCSDGLTNHVDDEEIEEIMRRNWYRRLPSVLVDLANERGGNDNITVVVAYAANQVD